MTANTLSNRPASRPVIAEDNTDLNIKYCDGRLFKRMLAAGGRWLSLNRGLLNELNVFPVPDGDTGTNMSLTIRGALSPLVACQGDDPVSKVAMAAARGALMGARGNSGVISSQILYGFASGLKGIDKANSKDMAVALRTAADFAYKSVQNPREGTILTVIRTMAEKAEATCNETENLNEFFSQITEEARQALLNSYKELPVLREAGVVDSGGLGLVFILEGIIKIARGEHMHDLHNVQEYTEKFALPTHEALSADIKYGFCVEYLVHGSPLSPDDVLPKLQTMGDSIVLAKTQDILKVHIHTNDYQAVEDLVTVGASSFKRKVEDMREQNRRRLERCEHDNANAQCQSEQPEFRGELTVVEPPTADEVRSANLPPLVAIAAGDGFAEYLQAWGIELVPGGQTSNPSAQEIMNAIAQAHARSGSERPVEVFCNNSNCIAAVRQAIALGQVAAKAIETVCPSQMIALLRQPLAYDNMSDYVAKLSHGEITQAVRDANVQGHNVHCGDFMSIWNNKLVGLTEDMEGSLQMMLEAQPVPAGARLVIVTGEDCDPEQAEKLLVKINEISPSVHIEFLWGGQPHYPILVTVE